MTRQKITLTLLSPLLSFVFAGMVQAQQGTTHRGKFQVNVSKGYLFLDASEAPLAKILEEIGKQAGIIIDSNIGPEEKITIRLDRVPLEDGIKQLAKNVSVFYAQDPNDKTRRIERVVVLTEGKEGAAGRPKASSQPAKAREPAQAATVKEPPPQPEPFKFEFDPAKFTEKKEMPRKQP